MTHLPDESSVRATGFLKKRRTGRTDPNMAMGLAVAYMLVDMA
jgi:hypothetical protein